jgi:toxin ParE1/3/4
MSEIRVRPAARRDLVEQAAYIAQDNPEASERFLLRAEETCELLSKMPGMGRIWTWQSVTLSGVRSFPVRDFQKYLIFYRPLHEGIEVLRVLHGARDLPGLLEDEPET